MGSWGRLSRRALLLGLLVVAACQATPTPAPVDPLPSWNDTASKQRIVAFVESVTTEGGPDYVAPAERIAVFDNDGTLWVEQPLYVQAVFALERLRDLAKADPALARRQPFKAFLENDRAAIATFGEPELAQLVFATHSNMTMEEFTALSRGWLATARDARYGRPHTELVYQPQLELLAYLRAEGFKTYIVSGGGVDFMRAYAEAAYGIPPEQVIGSSGKLRFELVGDEVRLVKLPEIGNLDDKAGKPENIALHIGRQPILAFGNSDGDLAMLQYAASGPLPGLMLLLHHDDAAREYAYDRDSGIGHLDQAWDEAVRRGWVVVSMRDDFRRVFPFDPE